LLSAIVESAADAIISKDLNGIIRSWNTAAENLFGYRADEVIGKPISILAPPDRQNEMPTILALIRAGDRVKHYETLRRRKDGELIHVSLTVSPVHDREGRIIGASTIARDITERKQAAQALQMSEERQRLAVDAGNVGLWDWDIVRNNVIWSDRIYEFHGLTPGSFDGTVEGFSRLVHPDDLPGVAEALRHALEQDEPYELEFRAVHPSGEIRWLSTRAKVLRDYDGNAMRMIGATLDITERKHWEQALEEREQFTRSILESSRDCIVVLSVDGNVVSMNTTGQHLLSMDKPGDVLGKPWLNQWTGVDREACAGAITVAKAGGTGLFEGYCPAGDGVPKWWHVQVTPIWDSHGKIAQLLAVLRDVTQARESAEALRTSEQRLRQIVETAAEGICLVNLGCKVVVANPRMGELVGYTAEELVGHNLLDMVPQDYRESARAGFECRLAGGKGSAGDYPIAHRDGSIRWLRVYASVVQDDRGGTTGVLGMFTDISASRQIEAALRASEARFRTIFELAAVGLAMTDLPEGRFIAANQKFLDITGYDLAELTARTFLEITHPEDRTGNERVYHELLEGSLPYYAYEKRYIRQDGGIVWVQSTISLVRDTDNQPIHTIGIIEDITARKNAVQSLHQSQNRLSLALEAGGLGVWDWDIIRDRLTWGEGFAALNGISDDVAPRSYADFMALVYPEDRCQVEQAVKDALERDEPYDVEFRTIRPDGKPHWVARKGMVLRESSGRPVRMLGVGSDITDRKNAEQELRKAKAQVDDILSSITESFIALDREWRFTYVNERVVERTGKGRDQLIGNRFWEVFPEAIKSPLWTEYHHVMEERVPCKFEAVYPRPDGSDHPASIHEVHAYPTDEGMCAYVLDITDRKRAEKAMEEREAFYRTMGDAVPDFIWVTDSGGRATYVNQHWQEYTGKTLEELNRLGWEWFNHPEERQAQEEKWAAAKQDGTRFEAEFRYRRRDGLYRWFMGRAVPLRDATGAIYQWVGTSTDIQRLKEAEAKLRRYNEQLEQFAFAAAHDLQEPLRNVSVFTQLLLRRLEDQLDPKSLEYFDLVHSSAQRLTNLVRDLLSYTGAVEGQIENTLVDSGDAARQAIEGLSGVIENTAAVITVDRLPVVYAFQPHLIQIFQNLIGNALKYRHPERTPSIRVSAEERGSRWCFSVRDNGIGIHPDYHERIFGVFKRLHGRNVDGTGIGLAIVKRIVEYYGGSIWVESTEGSGADFRFTLPALPEGGSD
jgi:PAS domain S-box-containing protein